MYLQQRAGKERIRMDDQTCPFCGGALEVGFLAAGGQPIKWTQKGRSMTGDALGEGEVGLQEGVQLLYKNTVRAMLCRSCRKVIADTLQD